MMRCLGVTGCSIIIVCSILWGAETRKKRRKTSEFLKDALSVLLRDFQGSMWMKIFAFYLCIFMAYLEAQRGSLNSTLMCCATDMFSWMCGSCGLKMVLLQKNWLPWLVAGETARREDWRASLLPSELDLLWALLPCLLLFSSESIGIDSIDQTSFIRFCIHLLYHVVSSQSRSWCLIPISSPLDWYCR